MKLINAREGYDNWSLAGCFLVGSSIELNKYGDTRGKVYEKENSTVPMYGVAFSDHEMHNLRITKAVTG